MPYRTEIDDVAVREYMRRVGGQVRTHRLLSAVSQSQLAALSSVSQPTISRLERGLAPGIRLERLAAIMVILEIPNLRFRKWD
jgi:transcriptional regulator with XRE-family HTH domain